MTLVEINDVTVVNPDLIGLVEQVGGDVYVHVFLGNKSVMKPSKYSFNETVERLIHGEAVRI